MYRGTDGLRRLIRNGLNQKIVALHATERASDRYAANCLIDAYRERFPVEGEPWHEDGFTDYQRKHVLPCVQSEELRNCGRSLTPYDRKGSSPTGRRGFASLGDSHTAAEQYAKQPGVHIIKGATGQPVGRPRKGIGSERFLATLKQRGISLSELGGAIRAGRHRTGEQWGYLGTFAACVIFDRPNIQEVATKLNCPPKTLYSYRKKGLAMLKELERSEVLDRIDAMESRLAESLNAIQWNVRVLAARHPEVRETDFFSDEDSAVTK